MKKISFILITVLCFTGQAFAFDKHFYVGGSIGATKVNGDKNVYVYQIHTPPRDSKVIELGWNSSDITNPELAGKVFAGYRLHKHFAIETTAYYFGKQKDNILEVGMGEYHSYGFSGSLLGIVPLGDKLEYFQKIGVLYTRFEMDSNSKKNVQELRTSNYRPRKWNIVNDEGISFLVGGGFNYKITDHIVLGIEAEWSPDVLNSDFEKTIEKVKFINEQMGDSNAIKKDRKVGYDIDLDILYISTSISYRF